MNHLYYGDNLHVLREHLDNESVNLIYLDPPFKLNHDYRAFWGKTEEKYAFEDRHANSKA